MNNTSNKTTTKPPPNDGPPKDGLDLGGGLSSERFYECLKPLAISDDDKARLTQGFAEDLIKRVVDHVSRIEILTTLDAALFHFAKNPSHISETKEQKTQQVQAEKDDLDEIIAQNTWVCNNLLTKQLWKIFKEINKTSELAFGAKYIEFKELPNGKVYMEDRYFLRKCKKHLADLNYKIPECLLHI